MYKTLAAEGLRLPMQAALDPSRISSFFLRFVEMSDYFFSKSVQVSWATERSFAASSVGA